MSYISDRELVNRLVDTLRQRNGHMPETEATALLEEQAPGRSASIIALGIASPGIFHKIRPGWYRSGSDLVISRAS